MKLNAIVSLYDIGVVKIDFDKGWTLKSGIWSPIYINFRLLQSEPKLLMAIAKELNALVTRKKLPFDVIASIPLGGLPIGVALSLESNVAHITPRMDKKGHGLGVSVDGIYKKGDRVLLVDDLITKATSKLEAIKELGAVGLTVKDVVVILDREQGGKEELEKQRYRFHALVTLPQVLTVLAKSQRITVQVHTKLRKYLSAKTQ